MPMWEHTGQEFTLNSTVEKFWAELVIQLVENGKQHTTVVCDAHQNTQAYSFQFKPGNQKHLHVPEYVNAPQSQQFYHISSLDQHPSSRHFTAACTVRLLFTTSINWRLLCLHVSELAQVSFRHVHGEAVFRPEGISVIVNILTEAGSTNQLVWRAAHSSLLRFWVNMLKTTWYHWNTNWTWWAS